MRRGSCCFRQSCVFLALSCVLGLEGVSGVAVEQSALPTNPTQALQLPTISARTPAGAYQTLFTLRFTGIKAVPFNLTVQGVLIKHLNKTLIPILGPAVFASFQESLTSNGPVITPFVDLETRVWSNIWNPPESAVNATEMQRQTYQAFVGFVLGVLGELGVDTTIVKAENIPHDAVAEVDAVITTRAIQLYAVIFQVCGNSDELLLASEVIFREVALRMEFEYFHGIRMTRTKMNTCSDGAPGLRFETDASMGLCAKNDNSSKYFCYAQPGEALRQGLSNATWVRESLQEAGLSVSVSVTSIFPLPYVDVPELESERAQDPIPTNSTVPWHLDRIDQRDLPLDGAFRAANKGSGVNVYFVSSGIRADHSEFCLTETDCSKSRVTGLWGYQGLNPLTDCDDADTYVGLGTYGASLVGGLTSGSAKNVTFFSVRFRKGCLIDDKSIWEPGGLPSAFDAVISNSRQPAVMVIDTWWSEGRFNNDEDDYLMSAFTDRLSKIEAQGILVVTQIGGGAWSDACRNIFANRSNTIVVGALNRRDIRSFWSPWNSPCIDIWAPGGDLGEGITGASAVSNTSFINMVLVDTAAMSVVAGVAAQYLSLHPEATPAEVKLALIEMSSRNMVHSIGPLSPRRELFTDFEEAALQDPDGGIDSAPPPPGSSFPIGAVVGIVLGVVGGLVLAMTLGALLYRRRRAKRSRESSDLTTMWSVQSKSVLDTSHSTMDLTGKTEEPKDFQLSNSFGPPGSTKTDTLLASDTSWKIDFDDIRVCKTAEGKDWVLGSGNFGSVYKAVKGGVQTVAVKVMHRSDSSLDRVFLREIEMMKYVSHDKNIVQFYGACIHRDRLALVVELMEGGDLRGALTSDHSGKLRWCADGKEIALDIARGLCHLHSQKVIHRDLESKNIMMTRDGTAKIGDVGMAKVLSEGYLTADDMMGTFAWAAPEVLMGTKCSEKVDIYSFGIVLWEIVTQEVPIRGTLRDPDVPRECPQEVVDLIQACTAIDAKARPSAKEVYDWLLRCPPLEQQGDPSSGSFRRDGNLPGRLGGQVHLGSHVAEGSSQLLFLQRMASEQGLIVLKAVEDWSDEDEEGEGMATHMAVPHDLSGSTDLMHDKQMIIHEEPEGEEVPHRSNSPSEPSEGSPDTKLSRRDSSRAEDDKASKLHNLDSSEPELDAVPNPHKTDSDRSETCGSPKLQGDANQAEGDSSPSLHTLGRSKSEEGPSRSLWKADSSKSNAVMPHKAETSEGDASPNSGTSNALLAPIPTLGKADSSNCERATNPPRLWKSRSAKLTGGVSPKLCAIGSSSGNRPS